MIALTFDDGPYQYDGTLLDTLKKYRVKATFFVNGNNYWDYTTEPRWSQFIKRAFEDGHQVCTHTFTHPDMATLTEQQILTEMQENQKAIYSALSTSKLWNKKWTRPLYMRPPYGSTNDLVLQVMKQMGYVVVTWDTDTEDSMTTGATAADSLKAYADILNGSANGSIVLQHSPIKSSATQLMQLVIPKIPKRYKLVTIDQCLGLGPAYK